eukprot:g19621.t1
MSGFAMVNPGETPACLVLRRPSCYTALHFEYYHTEPNAKPLLSLNMMLFGCTLKKIAENRNNSVRLGSHFSDHKEKTNMNQLRAQTVATIEGVMRVHFDSESRLYSADPWNCWLMCHVRELAESRKLWEWNFVTFLEHGGGEYTNFDMVGARMWLSCAQSRCLSAKKHYTKSKEKASEVSSTFVEVLMEPFITNSVSFKIYGECRLLSHRIPLQVFTDLATNGLLESGVFTTLVTPIGKNAFTFAQHIARLADPNATKAGKQEARFLLAWGFFVTLKQHLLVRQSQEKLFVHPIGIGTDEVNIGGRNVVQVRLRLPWNGGHVITLPLPPIILRRHTPKMIEDVIKQDNFINRSAQKRTVVKNTIAQAAALAKIQEFVSTDLIVGDELHLVACIDQGSSQRQFWLYMMLEEGKPVLVVFDPPHRCARDSILVAQEVLPKNFDRLIKLSTAAKKLHRAKLGDIMTYFLMAPDEALVEILGDSREDIEMVMGLSMDEPDCLDKVRRKMNSLRSDIGTFSSTKRLHKYSAAAEFVIKNWELLEVSTRLVLKKEKPSYFASNVRVQTMLDPDNDDRVLIIRNAGDMHLTAVDRQRTAEVLCDVGLQDRLEKDSDEEQEENDPGAGGNDEEENEEEEEGLAPKAEKETLLPRDDPPPSPAPKIVKAEMEDGADVRRGSREKPPSTTVAAGEKRKPVPKKAAAAPKKVDRNFFVVAHEIFSNPHARCRVLVFNRAQAAPYYFHNVQVAACWKWLNAHGIFWTMHPVMLSETAKWFNKELDARFDPVLRDVDNVMRRLLRTASVRVAQWSRVLIYGIEDCGDITLKDLENQVEKMEDSSLAKSIRPVLANPSKYIDSSSGLAVGLRPPEMYNYKLDSEQAVEDEDGVRFEIPLFTSHGHTWMIQPHMYELVMHSRVKRILRSSTPQAKTLAAFFMQTDNCCHVVQMVRLIAENKLYQAHEYMSKLQAVNPISTRDIEQRGGQLSKSATEANQAGSIVGDTPSYLIERLAAAFFPWLQPCNVDSMDTHPYKKGIRDSFSLLDGKQLIGEDGGDLRDVFPKVVEAFFPQGTKFENATPGLVDFELIEDWVANHVDPSKNDFAGNLEKLKEYFAKIPRPSNAKIHEKIRKIVFCNEEDHRLENDRVEGLMKWKNKFYSFPLIFFAEMLAFEREFFFTSESHILRERWARGRLNLLHLAGVGQRYRKMRRPFIVGHRSPCGQMQVYIVYMEIIPLRIICCYRLKEVTSPEMDLDEASKRERLYYPHFDSDDEESADVVQADAGMDVTMDMPIDAEPPAENETRNSDVRRLLRKRRNIDDMPTTGLHVYEMPDTPNSWAFPLPTQKTASESHLKGLFLTPVTLDNCTMIETGSHVALEVFTMARYRIHPNRKCVIEVNTRYGRRTPLQAAAMEGMLMSEGSWIHRGMQSTKGMLLETVTRLAQDEPARLKQLDDFEFTFNTDCDIDTSTYAGGMRYDPGAGRWYRHDPTSEGDDGVEYDLWGDKIVDYFAWRRGERQPQPGAAGGSSLGTSSAAGPSSAASKAASPTAAPAFNPMEPTGTGLPAGKKILIHSKTTMCEGRMKAHSVENATGTGFVDDANKVEWRPKILDEYETYHRMSLNMARLKEFPAETLSAMIPVLLLGVKNAETYLINCGWYTQRFPDTAPKNLRGKITVDLRKHCVDVMEKLKDAEVRAQQAEKRKVFVAPAPKAKPPAADGTNKKLPTKAQVKAADNKLAKALGEVVEEDDNDDNAICLDSSQEDGGADAVEVQEDFVVQADDETFGDLVAPAPLVAEQQSEVEELKNSERGRKQIEKAKFVLHDMQEDLAAMHVADKGRIYNLKCRLCKQQLTFNCVRVWCHTSGPRLEFWGPNAKRGTASKFRGLGPACHIVLRKEKTQCLCGYWKDGLLYKDETHTTRSPVNHMWRCAEWFAIIRARKEFNCCCPCDKLDQAYPCYGAKTTFGHLRAEPKFLQHVGADAPEREAEEELE